MSNLTLWRSRDPFAEFDSIVRRTFGPVSTTFVPAAEIERDGDDAVVRLELPGLDVAKDVTVEVDRGRLVVRRVQGQLARGAEGPAEVGQGGDAGSGERIQGRGQLQQDGTAADRSLAHLDHRHEG